MERGEKYLILSKADSIYECIYTCHNKFGIKAYFNLFVTILSNKLKPLLLPLEHLL